MLSLYYHELMEKVKEHKSKKYLIVDNYMLDKHSSDPPFIKGGGQLF